MADKTLLVKNCGDNVAGIYQSYITDAQGKPTWKKKGGGVFIYHMPPSYDPMWAFGERIGDSSNYYCAESQGTSSPLDVPQWGARGKPSIIEMKEKDTGKCPKMVMVESIYDNIDGGYVRMDNDFEGYPAYKNEQDGLFLFHDHCDGKWLISNELGSSANYNSCETDEVDVTKLESSMWREPKGISVIQEITWKNTVQDKGFRDYKFPADFPALGSEWIRNNPKYSNRDSVQWIRSTRLNRDLDQELFGQISPEQIEQGMVGDCWLIAAISCLAEFPGAVQALFSRSAVSENGRYDLKFYDIRKDEWVVVTVDDLLPCDKRNFWQLHAKPLFAKSNAAFLWPMIIEKAFAKFVGAYGTLSGGKEGFAWQAFTGCSKQYHYSRERDNSWHIYQLNVEEQKKEIRQKRRACPMIGGKDKLAPDAMWKVLKDSDKANYMMGASIGVEGDETEHKRQTGLVEGHAYSLISAVETRGFRFLKLRNPWGKFEWNGDWSDDWAGWTRYKEIKEELHVERLVDGCFWMEWKDFCKNYTTISICAQSMASPRSLGHVDLGVVGGAEKCNDGNALAALTSQRKKNRAQAKPTSEIKPTTSPCGTDRMSAEERGIENGKGPKAIADRRPTISPRRTDGIIQEEKGIENGKGLKGITDSRPAMSSLKADRISVEEQRIESRTGPQNGYGSGSAVRAPLPPPLSPPQCQTRALDSISLSPRCQTRTLDSEPELGSIMVSLKRNSERLAALRQQLAKELTEYHSTRQGRSVKNYALMPTS